MAARTRQEKPAKRLKYQRADLRSDARFDQPEPRLERQWPARADVGNWVSVEDRLPTSGQFVLAYFVNSYKKGRRIRAMFITKCSEIAIDDEDDGGGEYSEEHDEYFVREGWYEANECEETHWRVTDPVTHWMPLPAPPCVDEHGDATREVMNEWDEV